MGFTRSTTNISVHQGLSDYPNQDDGLSAEQLKERFDFPAETLQDDLNNLEDELEAVTAAGSVGAEPITVGDESDANVQAKLNKIYEDMQDITQGSVADGSITEAKLDSTLVNSLAKKDGTLQTGLNAEKLGGSTLAQIQALISGNIVAGTYTGNSTTSTKTNTVSVGFQPKLTLIWGYLYRQGASSYDSMVVLIGNTGTAISKVANATGGTFTVTLTSTGFTLTGTDMNYSGKTYSYVAFK